MVSELAGEERIITKMYTNGRITQLATKYDRSIVAIVIGLGMIISFYVSVGNMVENLVRKSDVVKKQEIINAVQAEVNKNINNTVDRNTTRLEKLEQKINEIYQYIKNKP